MSDAWFAAGSLWALGAAAAAWVGGRHLTLRRRIFELESRLRAEACERRQLQDRLAENERRLRIIIESEPECVKLQAADGRILEMNPAGLALVEADRPEQIIGCPVYDVIAPESRARYQELTREVFEGKACTLEFSLIGLRGTRRWMETHAVPLRDASGNIVALLAITRDITERRHAEEQARQHLTQLAHVGRVSTMGEMASGIAHELNQPLAAIANFARGAVRRVEAGHGTAADVMEALQQIASQAQRAGEIIRHLREFVRKGEPRWSAVDVNGLVRSIAQLAEPEARLHGVAVTLDLPEGIPPARADTIEIEQVLLNLLRNAVEAMADGPGGQGGLCVSTRHDPAAGLVVVAVRDSGPGVSDEILGQMFDPFFTTKAEGMGMGLSISRSIIEAHGGRLWVTRNPDRGVTFHFALHVFAAEA